MPAAKSSTMETDLHTVAGRLFWWTTPEEALKDVPRFLAQVMTYGTWNDIQTAIAAFGENAFREVLKNPPAGVFDAKSWNYWHVRFNIKPVPPLPRRELL